MLNHLKSNIQSSTMKVQIFIVLALCVLASAQYDYSCINTRHGCCCAFPKRTCFVKDTSGTYQLQTLNSTLSGYNSTVFTVSIEDSNNNYVLGTLSPTDTLQPSSMYLSLWHVSIKGYDWYDIVAVTPKTCFPSKHSLVVETLLPNDVVQQITVVM